ncbi:hypothetical protein E0Z10_g10396 [Xylaria hypoxylon]|uniref:Uncharacterized protein n=1 Tax=Xylaria hypoxylon TaxID=37992 RepID=A0A4Z0YGK0_9PEZI|nr:hypothetical protein E0Z10_g10396 [Xylaria hypoxylon]
MTRLSTYSALIGTPISESQQSHSLLTPATPSAPLPRTSLITRDTSQSAIETDSSSTISILSHNPVPPTDIRQFSNKEHRNTDFINRVHPMVLLRPSQETESCPSDSSYRFSGSSDNSVGLNIADKIGTMGSFVDLHDNTSPTAFGGATIEVNVAPRGGGAARGGRGRDRVTPRGRGGTYRPAKRVRNRRDEDDDPDDDDEYIDETTPKKKGKRRQKAAPVPDPDNHPAEIHRRKSCLRDRLIKGNTEPQPIGMRAYNIKKAAATAAAAQAPAALAHPRNPTRQFLVPMEPRQDLAMTPFQPPYNAANNIASSINTAGVQPNFHIAYTSTPIHQLHFPEALVLALKQSVSKWEAKVHTGRCVFVALRILGSDVADMHVFPNLRHAIADTLYKVANKHPEAFALARDKDDNGNEIKPEKSLEASTVIQEITARPAFQQVPMPTSLASADEANTDEADVEEGSLFVIKDEYTEWAQPPRITDPRPDFNSRGELLFRDAPEPIYVFWGRYKVSSNGLKMEALRADGSVVKVSVHFKNIRKPD